MIPVGGVTISALSPWFLLAAPLASGLLLYAYRKRGNAARQVVSSLFLMRQLPRSSPGKKRFVPPLQFWIELLLFLTLTCAAATCVVGTRGEQIAIVLDTSLSMTAVDRAGASRLERARSYASADIVQALPLTHFTIFTAHSQLEQVTKRGVSQAEALAAIGGTQPAQDADSLSTHLEQLLAQGSYDGVWVYTDRSFTTVEHSSRRNRFVTLPIGPEEQQNIWLASITRKGSASDSVINASVESSANTTAQVSLSASCFDGKSSRFEVAAAPFTLQPSGQHTAAIQLGSRSWAYCQLKLDLPAQSSNDHLVHDNQGWITNSSEGTALRISSPLSALELGLGAVKGFSFSANTVESQRHTPVIYHRMAPPSDDLVSPTLVILPPAGKLPNGGLARDSGQGALAVTRWTSSHPLLKYVNPSLLSFPVSRTLQCPGATNPILFSKNGALACAGEVNGVPYGVVGFELFPFDGKRSATISIFTLNLLSWLAEGSTRSSLTQRPGLIALPRGTTEARYIAPETKALSIDQQRSTITAPVPGIIELTAEKTRSFMAITLSAREESALNRLPPLTAPAGSVASAAPRSTETPSDLTSWLALVALLTLIGDVIRRIAVRQRWSML